MWLVKWVQIFSGRFLLKLFVFVKRVGGWGVGWWEFCIFFTHAKKNEPKKECKRVGGGVESQICHEMDLFLSYRPLDTTHIPEISSRIHFWRLEGPEMAKKGLKLRFSIKSQFSWGRFRSEPPARRPPAPVQPLGVADTSILTENENRVGGRWGGLGFWD